MEHEHAWVSLESHQAGIDVVRAVRAYPGIRSYYEVVAVCTIQGCFAGRTRDGVIFDDVRQGEVSEDLIVRTTSGLKLRR